MNKLILVALLMLGTSGVYAASFTWGVTGLRGPNLYSRWTGDVTIYCATAGFDSFSHTATATDKGAIVADTSSASTTLFSNDAFEAGQTYSFYFQIVDTNTGKMLTSENVSATAQANDVVVIDFASYGTFTQVATNWVPVPEPTSGLLLLIGVAGLALRRKRA